MKNGFYLFSALILATFIFFGFKSNCQNHKTLNSVIEKKPFNFKAKTIEKRFHCLDGFSREKLDSNSFGYFLRNLPLKDSGAKVKLFDGNEKKANDVYCSVINLPIGNRDLHQCADAVMRLRADFLFQNKRYSEIKFLLVSGKWLDYITFSKNDFSYNKYWKYLEQVFSFANTASLKKQLKSKDLNEISIGDVLVQSGNPYGHAVIVVDLAKNEKGEKQFMLAQSYMPAQELQILFNPLKINQVWYSASEIKTVINTPEWLFYTSDLKSW